MTEKRIDILIVEDIDTMRSLLDQVVAGIEGVRVTGLARNTWDARIELSKRRPSLVLLDEVLPGESSVDLLTEIRAQGIPVLLITGMENPTHRLPAGAAGRVTKPAWDTLETDRKRIEAAIRKAALSG